MKRIMFSPVTRLSGLLSVDVVVDNGCVVDANASGTIFRGFEHIMQGHHVTDAVYMTQRVCGICSLAHGAVASYLLDEVFDNDVSENAQYLRNIMYAADFLQNHIRHFYVFSLPDFVDMPNCPPFQKQNLVDCRLNPEENRRLASHYLLAVKAAQESHQILALFGGKAPHQHSFVYGGVAVAPTADKINQALALLDSISDFVKQCLLPDTELIARIYNDYYFIGLTPRQLLSFGLFKFGAKNEQVLWRSGLLEDDTISRPKVNDISENICHSWYEFDAEHQEIVPDPHKTGAYTWIRAVKYAGKYFQGGPLARMIINGKYNGSTSTMDRIFARSIETMLITELMQGWLKKLEPGLPPISQKKAIVKNQVTAVTDAMRGVLLHSASIQDGQVSKYNIITPTAWNFSPKDCHGNMGPVESALVGTKVAREDLVYTVLGRIIRSFDPCIACATHVLNGKGETVKEYNF